MFHDIGLDRLVNSYRVPVVINRPVAVRSCPGRQRVMDMDNVTYSALVGAGGLLSFQDMTLQGSKSQSKSDWPSNIPLLLSSFKPVDNGRVQVRNSTIRVRSTSLLAAALEQLPSGTLMTLEVPDLQPRYAGPPCSTRGNSSCTISFWKLTQQGWQLFKAGGKATLSSVGTAFWEFDNVLVEPYVPDHCFEGAARMVSSWGGLSLVSDEGVCKSPVQPSCTCSSTCHRASLQQASVEQQLDSCLTSAQDDPRPLLPRLCSLQPAVCLRSMLADHCSLLSCCCRARCLRIRGRWRGCPQVRTCWHSWPTPVCAISRWWMTSPSQRRPLGRSPSTGGPQEAVDQWGRKAERHGGHAPTDAGWGQLGVSGCTKCVV